eukprot:TRINITY_DN34026_c0_g1_i4.p1 TRINITY_DN34026_c0_g1~~TRINITY_DN34026_c0_g1_i4.p1  ORF type:complete len:223 (-),score=42.48 TRINITY_DN34026_c0_g1_i4:678-1346(-)
MPGERRKMTKHDIAPTDKLQPTSMQSTKSSEGGKFGAGCEMEEKEICFLKNFTSRSGRNRRMLMRNGMANRDPTFSGNSSVELLMSQRIERWSRLDLQGLTTKRMKGLLEKMQKTKMNSTNTDASARLESLMRKVSSQMEMLEEEELKESLSPKEIELSEPQSKEEHEDDKDSQLEEPVNCDDRPIESQLEEDDGKRSHLGQQIDQWTRRVNTCPEKSREGR